MLSVVIPTLNAERTLPFALAPLVPATMAGLVRQVVIVDGGSQDATRAIAEESGADVVVAPPSRGGQLQAGAAAARAAFLLFLHADTVLTGDWADAVAGFIASADAAQRAAAFTFGFDDQSFAAGLVARWVNVRSRVFGLPYGDQGLLIARPLYDEIGGYRAIPLMEDVDLVRRLGKRRIRMMRAVAVTSADRYRRDGYFMRGARNLVLLARFLTGADPHDLRKAYG